MADLNVMMHVDHLAEFMFTKNVNNAYIELTLNGLQNTKDMFFFCLDLFCKGLVFMFGVNYRVNVQELTLENFQQLRDKMRLAGIEITFDAQPPDVDMPKDELFINLQELHDAPEELALKDYKFILKCTDFTYVVSFDLFHIADRDCNSRRIM